MNITFLGAAGGVTGSKHLVEVAGKKILLDCGTFQGQSDVAERNRALPFPPESIDAVILSHAHLDHCGMLPLLVKRGYTGPIYSTPATADVARYMLRDAASIETQDAQYRAEHNIGAPDEREPLFTVEDIEPVMKKFKPIDYVRRQSGWHEIFPGIAIKFYDAGHILGSAVTVLKATEDGKDVTLAFTGDLGPQSQPLLPSPEIPTDHIDALIMESTYGGRNHDPLEQVEERLVRAIHHVIAQGGKMVVPAFSLGRTQSFLYTIHKLIDANRIPRFPVYVDSPLATEISSIYRRYKTEYDEQSSKDFPRLDDEPLSFRNLRYVSSVQESKALNEEKGPCMIISASGMMSAGRVVHHLRHSIGNSRNAVFITGYQAAGTIGRRLLDGAQTIELHGDSFPVRAQMYLFNEFSAHGDQAELITFATSLKGVQQVMLVHGEISQAMELEEKLFQARTDWQVKRPNEGDQIFVPSKVIE